MAGTQFDEDEDWDEESVDDDDVEIDDESTVTGGAQEMTVADIEFDDSHAVVRSNRSIPFSFILTGVVEVIEPPTVFNADIEQILKKLLREALSGFRLGVVTSYKVENRTDKEAE